MRSGFRCSDEIGNHKGIPSRALDAKANINIKQQLRSFKSHNVIGKLDGSDPKLQDEYVIYTAHWDHLGRNPELQGDQIFNGAIDNASGIGSLIELAAAFTKLNPPPKRSVLFMATTAEEAGLLGAKFYAEHPLYPLEKTLADINIDNPWDKTRDIEDLSDNNSTLDDLLATAARRNGRVMTPNRQPEKGSFYRADTLNFRSSACLRFTLAAAKISSANRPISAAKRKTITRRIITIRFRTSLTFEVAYEVANGAKFPEWKPGNEFKAKRGEMLKD